MLIFILLNNMLGLYNSSKYQTSIAILFYLFIALITYFLLVVWLNLLLWVEEEIILVMFILKFCSQSMSVFSKVHVHTTFQIILFLMTICQFFQYIFIFDKFVETYKKDFRPKSQAFAHDFRLV